MRSPVGPHPTATYRLQLTPQWGFAEAESVLCYLHDLGVSHLYLSPILQATPGSTHGYDVVDHDRINVELGGEDGFRSLATAARGFGMGIVVDVVPNHMAVPVPVSGNAALWSVLRDGPASPFARWFDVDWAAQHQAVLMPVLGQRIGDCLQAGEIRLDTSGRHPRLSYYDHVFPVRPGTEELALPELIDRQWYRLAHWKVGHEELNYRRFFDVDGLAAIRVEDPDVFECTHRVLLRLHHEGLIHGFRIDHPDGLANPRDYLRTLRAAAPSAWIVVEKILEGLDSDAEMLPGDWPCDGTTGYETLNRALGVLVDPAGAAPLTAQWTALADPQWHEYGEVVERSKRDVLDGPLRAEITRLADVAHEVCSEDIMLRDHTRRSLREALEELLVAFSVYRAYVVPGEDPPAGSVALLDEAVASATERRPDLADELAVLQDLALLRTGRHGDPRRDEFCVRFQQTCGPVMAKGVEDTASYRWLRLLALNDVGGDPGHLAVLPDSLHTWFARQQEAHPSGMTTLSTHDTKRSEDTRARLAALSDLAEEWQVAVAGWEDHVVASYANPQPDRETTYLLWQTLVGTWPINEERLSGYLTKAVREAKIHTSWTAVDERYEESVLDLARFTVTDEKLKGLIGSFVRELDQVASVTTLAQKALQLTAPGVPDVYQGCELVDRSLVDPDNRRAVDFDYRASLLAEIRERGFTVDRTAANWLDRAKLALTSRVLRLRRDSPHHFDADAAYRPIATTTAHVFAYFRGEDLATAVTRRPAALARLGGWGSASIVLPPGTWHDVVTDQVQHGGELPAGELFSELPVAVLRRTS